MKRKDGKVKMNNKGFSLVELIVVIAIMAVLVGILAPQYLRYVEKARLQKDNSAIAEIANAIKIAMADETINDATNDGDKITSANVSPTDKSKQIKFNTTPPLQAELAMTIGTTWTSGSNTYKNSTTQIEFTVNKAADGIISVTVTGYYGSVPKNSTTNSTSITF